MKKAGNSPPDVSQMHFSQLVWLILRILDILIRPYTVIIGGSPDKSRHRFGGTPLAGCTGCKIS